MTGMHEQLEEVILDLRDHSALVDQLEAVEAITEGWPNQTQQHPIVVRVQPITEVSTHRRSATQSTVRTQFSVVAEKGWRRDQQRPMYAMARIMAAIADRMDVAAPTSGAAPGGVASGSWQPVEGDRLALVQDWRVTTLRSTD